MAKVNVAQFATELKLSADKLVAQLKAAGVKKALTEETALTEGDKTKLLEYLRKAHGASDGKSKITLTRRQTSEIRKSDGSGKARTIQVEVRKKRVLVKRDPAADEEKKPVTVAPEQPALTAKQEEERPAGRIDCPPSIRGGGQEGQTKPESSGSGGSSPGTRQAGGNCRTGGDQAAKSGGEGVDNGCQEGSNRGHAA